MSEVLGREPHTPLDEAVEAALRGIGCLPHEPQQDAGGLGAWARHVR
jgi:hypothetical protein